MPRDTVDIWSIRPIEFPPGVLVARSTPQRQIEIEELQLTNESPNFVNRRCRITPKPDKILGNAFRDASGEIRKRYAEIRMRVGASRVQFSDLSFTSSQVWKITCLRFRVVRWPLAAQCRRIILGKTFEEQVQVTNRLRSSQITQFPGKYTATISVL